MLKIKSKSFESCCKYLHSNCFSIDLFKKWFEENEVIARYNYFGSYLELNKHGTRGIRDSSLYINNNFPFKDHVSFWKLKNGERLLISHCYNIDAYIINGKCEELENWAIKKNLQVIYYGKELSWYYPNKTFMFGIKAINFNDKYKD
jgi:hypothetical protein